MMVKRDKKGRITNRVPGQYSNKLYSFRVTKQEHELIHRAKKLGLDPRMIILKEARKLVTNDKGQ